MYRILKIGMDVHSTNYIHCAMEEPIDSLIVFTVSDTIPFVHKLFTVPDTIKSVDTIYTAGYNCTEKS